MILFSLNLNHDGSLFVFRDGELLTSFEEQRITGTKHDGDPVYSLFLAIEKYGFPDVILLTTTFNSHYTSQLTFRRGNFYYELLQKNKRNKNFKLYINDGRLHHLWHAYSSYFNSGFNNGPVLSFVFDGTGSGITIDRKIPESYLRYDGSESNSIFVIDNEKFTTLYKHISCRDSVPNTKIVWGDNRDTFEEVLNSPVILQDTDYNFNTSLPYSDIQDITLLNMTNNVSLGKMYNAVTMMCGFDQQYPGKTMGLSAYGNKVYELLDKNLLPKKDFFSYIHSTPIGYFDDITFEVMKDIACSCQKDLENSIENTVIEYYEKTGIKNITLSGGVALNILNNSNLRKKLPKDVNFWAEPLASDVGTSLGFAYYFNLINNYENKPENFIYSHHKSNINFSNFSVEPENLEQIINALECEKIIGVFSECGEIGPRALGNRSLLLDPRLINGKELMNNLKNREFFRPFAGIILEEYLLEWFEDISLKNNPYMMFSLMVKEIKKNKIPSIIHEDNTCRIQTVNKKQNSHMYDLLTYWNKKTGIPVLMNTSLNVSGMPIAECEDDLKNLLETEKVELIWVPEQKIFLRK